MNRAYSLLTVKSVQEDQRIITGTATTPTTDRVGDIVDPLGVKFKNPMPLLLHHQSDMPVGTVRFDKPTKDGIDFTAKLPQPKISDTLKSRVDEAWESIKLGLIRGVSIGFRPLEYSMLDDGGVRFVESEVMELSLVTIPANADASIQTIKSLDQEQLAATGRKLPSVVRLSPGASGLRETPKAPEGKRMATLAEQITALEAKRAAHVARMDEINTKALDEGRTKDEAEREDYRTLGSEIAAIDDELKDFRDMEAIKAKSAKPVIKPIVTDEGDGVVVRHSIDVKAPPKLGPGIGFAQLTRAKMIARLDGERAVDVAERMFGEQSIVVGTLKATVPAGSTISGNWAYNLVQQTGGVVADFVEYLRPRTIIGQFGTNGIPGLRNVSFYVPLVSQTGAGAGYWVGQGKAKPLTKFDFTSTTLTPLKVANICVLTEESIRDSSPKADTIVRDELVKALTARLDTDFVDPTKTASAGVSPASITYGAAHVASTGTDGDAVRLDIRSMFDIYDQADNPADEAVIIMGPRNARGAAGLRNDLGQSEFPTMTPRGGTLDGMPVIVSRYAGDNIIIVNASDIYLADDGGVNVDMSREASLEMSDAPTHDSITPSGASLVSLFQTNSVAIRAERTINWARRRTPSVVYLTGAQWGGDLATV